jgi:hypothetical protein
MSARLVAGAASLPLAVTVELDAIFEVTTWCAIDGLETADKRS